MKIKFKGGNMPTAGILPPIALKIIRYCNSLNDGDVVDRISVAVSICANVDSIRQVPPEFLKQNRHIIKGKAWFGNPRTITELKMQFP